MGVGVDSIDLDAATELGILACNVPGINTAEVAEHAAAMLFALTRRIVDSVRTTRDGGWRDDRKLTVGIYALCSPDSWTHGRRNWFWQYWSCIRPAHERLWSSHHYRARPLCTSDNSRFAWRAARLAGRIVEAVRLCLDSYSAYRGDAAPYQRGHA